LRSIGSTIANYPWARYADRWNECVAVTTSYSGDYRRYTRKGDTWELASTGYGQDWASWHCVQQW
jgi:hypothetical protein